MEQVSIGFTRTFNSDCQQSTQGRPRGRSTGLWKPAKMKRPHCKTDLWLLWGCLPTWADRQLDSSDILPEREEWEIEKTTDGLLNIPPSPILFLFSLGWMLMMEFRSVMENKVAACFIQSRLQYIKIMTSIYYCLLHPPLIAVKGLNYLNTNLSGTKSMVIPLLYYLPSPFYDTPYQTPLHCCLTNLWM